MCDKCNIAEGESATIQDDTGRGITAMLNNYGDQWVIEIVCNDNYECIDIEYCPFCGRKLR